MTEKTIRSMKRYIPKNTIFIMELSIKVFLSFASIDKKRFPRGRESFKILYYFFSPLTNLCLIHAVCALFAFVHFAHGVQALAHLLDAIFSPRQARHASQLDDTFPTSQTLHFVFFALSSDPALQVSFVAVFLTTVVLVVWLTVLVNAHA